jgi:peptidoglycan/LPS O-acetylase OafA/YrhL
VTTAPATGYRGDIDGLRAIAVLAVLAYHYGLPLPGGFTGVDVFFVISGYLITGILFREIEQGTFSVRGFYGRRIRRILPALLVMLVVVCVCGNVLQFPGDYADTAKSAMFAALGISNFYFHSHTGYFDQPAEFMPLLHTWSLAVEEQFYVVWPVLLALITRLSGRRKGRIAIAITALAATSFATSLATLSIDPKTAFYFPHTRAWELALGSALAFLPPLPRREGELANLAGLALVAAGLIFISDKAPFPGWNALLPCFGSALILWAKSPTLSGRCLALMRGIGLISYSLYLWHWPVWVFYRLYINNRIPTATEAVLVAFVAITVSILSYVAVEQPFRRIRPPHLVTIGVGVASALTTALFAFGIVSMDGFPSRVPATLLALRSGNEMWNWAACRPSPSLIYKIPGECEFGSPWMSASHKGVLWGDSHAGHFAPVIEPFARDADASFLLYETCPAFIDGVTVSRYLPGDPEYSEKCGASRTTVLRMLDEHPDVTLVVLAASWAYRPPELFSADPPQRSPEIGIKLFEEGLERTILRINAPGRRIVLVGSIPQWSDSPVPCELARAPLWRAPCAPPTLTRQASLDFQGPTYAVFKALEARNPNVTAVLPSETMCDGDRCGSHLNGELLYKDGSHLRRNLSEQTLRQLGRKIGLNRMFDEPERADDAPHAPRRTN